MNSSFLDTRAGRFFWRVTAYPTTILAISILIILAAAVFLPRLTKDTSSEAFIPPDHPSVVYREVVREIFGLSDPVVIAVVNEGENGVFNPQTLHLVSWLTERVAEIEGVDPERVTSLATENNIVGTEHGMLVEPFFAAPPETQAEAEAVREAVMDFPLYLGSLVARDGSATLIVAELLDVKKGDSVYTEFLALAERAPTNGERIHVAGEGAVSGYLGKYIDDDAKRLNILAALIVSGILFLAYRTARGLFLPNLVVLGAVTVRSEVWQLLVCRFT